MAMPVAHRPSAARTDAACMAALQDRAPPRKNRNAFKSGFYTREEIEQRRRIQDLIRQSRKFLSQFDEGLTHKVSDGNLLPKDKTDDWNHPD